MHEEAPARLEPAVNPAKQFLVVAHVLEHLHRHDAIEALARVEVVHVRSDNLDVVEAPRRRLRADVIALGG